MPQKEITNFSDFWLFYLREHGNPLNRWLHFIGSSCGMLCLVSALLSGNWFFLPLGFLVGYGLAWIGHFFVERNQPASFRYPFWSFRADWKMWARMLTGRLHGELQRAQMSAWR